VKPEHNFVAERSVANHAALFRQDNTPTVDPADALAAFAERLTRTLPETLAALGNGSMPDCVAGMPREGVMRELLSRSSGLCSHSLLCGPGNGPTLLVSIEAAGVFQFVDMAFGGEGKVPDPLPARFPLSAQLVAARIESAFAALAARIGGIGGDTEPAFTPLRHDTDIAALRPFAADCPLWQVGFEIAFPGCDPWTVRLTLAATHVGGLCGNQDEAAPAIIPAADAGLSNPAGSPFGDIPLTLRATLVDMHIPLARIAALKPGDVLPVSVARHVPLSTGQATIAHGTVGEMDDRVALQIIQAFATEEPRP
jgi:flagellar motor switch protein FliM